MYANKVKKIAAVHDLREWGAYLHCRYSYSFIHGLSGSVRFLPDCIIQPHPGFSFLDPGRMKCASKIIAQWKKLEVQFDAIYTGYLGSEQISDCFLDFIKDFVSRIA